MLWEMDLLHNEDTIVLFDDLFLAAVCDASTTQFVAVLAGLSSTLVECLSDEERRAIGFPSSLDGSLRAEVVVALGNPLALAIVTEKDLVRVNLDLFTTVADDGTLLQMSTSLAEMDSSLIVGAGDVKDLVVCVVLLAAHDGAPGDILSVGQDPGVRALRTRAMERSRARLSVLEPVGHGPSIGLLVFLTLLVRVEGSKASSQKTSARKKTATELELLLPLIVEVVPVGLLLLFRGLGCCGVSALASATVLELLLLGWLLLLLLLLLLLPLLAFAAVVMSTVVSATTGAALILHATPERGGVGWRPIALTPVWLDDFVGDALIDHDGVVVVLCAGFPLLDHDEVLSRVGLNDEDDESWKEDER